MNIKSLKTPLHVQGPSPMTLLNTDMTAERSADAKTNDGERDAVSGNPCVTTGVDVGMEEDGADIATEREVRGYNYFVALMQLG